MRQEMWSGMGYMAALQQLARACIAELEELGPGSQPGLVLGED